MAKIYLAIPKNKKYLREIRTDEYSIGVMPLKSLPFSFRPSELVSENETIERDIDDICLDEIKQSCLAFARNKLLDYLASSEKTRYDCIDFLKRYQIPENQIQDLIQWAEEKKYLSDERYTEMFIEENLLSCKSPEEIRFKLRQKKINSAVIDNKIKELYTPELKTEMLEQLIDKLVSYHISAGDKKCYEKCAATLYRKGFRYDDFSRILYNRIHKSLDE